MAENLYTTMDRGTMSVEHRGEKAECVLPKWFSGCVEYMDNQDFDGLVEHLQAHNVDPLALMVSGLQEERIAMRAAFRPKDKESAPQPLDAQRGQRNVDKYVPSLLKRPGQVSQTKTAMGAAEMAQKLLAKGYSLEAISKMSPAELLAAANK